MPSGALGALGALRILAFAAVTAGAILLAAPDDRAPKPAAVVDGSPLPEVRPRSPAS